MLIADTLTNPLATVSTMEWFRDEGKVNKGIIVMYAEYINNREYIEGDDQQIREKIRTEQNCPNGLYRTKS